MKSYKRKLPIGAEPLDNQAGTHFRVWAPAVSHLNVMVKSPNESSSVCYPLDKEEFGYFTGFVEEANVGDLYGFQLSDSESIYPDPASRYQPKGPHGPSQIVNNLTFSWHDSDWKGISEADRVIYEMHIGTFTQEGTLQSAKRELIELADLGITIIELMPLNEFPGKFGWGYDGVNLFAPFHHYGTPQDLCAFIDTAHQFNIAVILDVVYNHFGPDGNYLSIFSPAYFTKTYTTEWGDAINFHEEQSEHVRLFFKTNARYWIEEFHFDGLRLDATQNIYDISSPHILAEISQEIESIFPQKQIYLIAENESQEVKHVLPREEGGYGLSAVWNDDFHHSAMVRLTGKRDAYYHDYLGTVQEFISAIKYGYLYQGQWYAWQNKKRGSSSEKLSCTCFINFIQNHDQIANSAHGLRIQKLTDPGNYRAMTALLLLSPCTPLLFQGQEFAATSPFYYFADHHLELACLVFQGRKSYFQQFPTIGTPEVQALLPNPESFETFSACKLQFCERHKNFQEYALHRDLLKLRKNDGVFNSISFESIDGSVLNQDCFLLRYFSKSLEDTRLIIVNFGRDFILSPAPDPLLAAPSNSSWQVLWSSENTRYGGGGIVPLSTDGHWCVQGHSTLVLIPESPESK